MRPSDALRDRIDAVRAIIARHPVANPRIFGSVARGEDVDGSDLDLLVDPKGRTTYFDLAGLQIELEALLGVPVDILTPRSLKPAIADRIHRDTRPL